MKKKDKEKIEILSNTPRLMRQRDVVQQVQSEGILKRLIASGWLTPAVREKKFVAYRRSDVEAVVDRILKGEMPPPLPARREKAHAS